MRVSFGLSFEKILVIAVIAVFLLGPDRLPHYAAQLGRLVRRLRSVANGARDRLREEMGPDFDDVDWKKLDPRQYDPRRIIREALLEDDGIDYVPTPTVSRSVTATAASDEDGARTASASEPGGGAEQSADGRAEEPAAQPSRAASPGGAGATQEAVFDHEAT